MSEQILPPIEIPLSSLSREALSGVIENFILREGTDYGSNEVSYEAKERQVMKQLERGDVKIVFDPSEETVSLMTELYWKKLTKNRSGSD
jgi:uncharacterized protein